MPVMALVAAVLLLGLLGLSGCTEEPQLVGQMGISADAQGRPMLVLATCGGSIDDVQLALLPYGDQTESGQVGEWTASTAVSGLARVALAGQSPGWAGSTVTLDPELHYIASASSTSSKTDALNDVTFTGRQVATLDPAEVYLNSSDPDSTELVPHPAASFADWACEHD